MTRPRRQYVLIRWKSQWGGNDRIVWINVKKLDSAWRADSLYVVPSAPDAKGMSYKYARFGAWLEANFANIRVNMPHICMVGGVVSITDGRHRFAWCCDHGVRALPVTVGSTKEATAIGYHLGTKTRRCILASL